jgi:hypothetical protein
LTLGVSLALAILGAVGLNGSPWGLGTGAWAGLFGGVTVLASLVAARRRQAVSETISIAMPQSGLGWSQWALLGLAGLLTVGAVTLVRTPRPVSGVVGYTTLWITPGAEPDTTGIRLGLNSSEFTTTSYRLTVSLEGRLALEVPEITLEPGGTWERRIELPEATLATVVEATLYRLDAPTVIYRHVRLRR